MKQLTCDICGGKLVVGSNGLAVCDSCGMEHSIDRIREKVQEIKGTVRLDNTHMIGNYLEIANNAYNAGNNAESESYCNKIIEIDPTNYQAWFLKGKAAGWQSTLQNPRISESVFAFTKAITNAPETDKQTLIIQSKEEIINLSKATISLRGQHFAKWPDQEETNGFASDITTILNALSEFIAQANIVIKPSELMAPLASIINQSVMTAYWDVIFPDYNRNPNVDDRANKYDWQQYIDRIGYCTVLLEQAINLCDEDEEDDIQRYKNLIYLHEQAIDSCSWDYDLVPWGKTWHKEWQLSENAKSFRHNKISDYKSKIDAIQSKMDAIHHSQKEELKRRIDEYWSKHSDEKNALVAERTNLEKKYFHYKQKSLTFQRAKKKRTFKNISMPYTQRKVP